jgi:hypothetical protein
MENSQALKQAKSATLVLFVGEKVVVHQIETMCVDVAKK